MHVAISRTNHDEDVQVANSCIPYFTLMGCVKLESARPDNCTFLEVVQIDIMPNVDIACNSDMKI